MHADGLSLDSRSRTAHRFHRTTHGHNRSASRLLGCGVVGAGVVRILGEQRELLAPPHRADVRHPPRRRARPRQARGSIAGILPLTTDAHAAIDDPRVQDRRRADRRHRRRRTRSSKRALRLGKPVVTANKSLLAARGPELFALAREHDTCIAFEASCGGGIPIIDALTRGLVANRIDALVGIVNGTCNVILTRMTRNGWTLRSRRWPKRRKLGFAEADPTLDVSGRDAAQKLALLASLAFNVQRRRARHPRRRHRADRAAGHRSSRASWATSIKLLAIAERSADAATALSLRVHPTLVHTDDVLADVGGSFNAISVYGHALGHALFYGRGAGQMPTASAVVVRPGRRRAGHDAAGVQAAARSSPTRRRRPTCCRSSSSRRATTCG